MYAVGLMSGTSLDGVDAALIKIERHQQKPQVEMIDFITIPFSPSLEEEIRECLSLHESNVQKICSLNYKLGLFYADAVKKICKQNQLSLSNLSFIGSHGQTLFHQPQKNANYAPSTMQIGEAAVIAYETQTTVVSNFRAMDLAAGGQGAPLVPYVDWLLYQNKETSRLLQNIGGISNVTALPADGTIDHIRAFDTGPGNLIIDEICRLLFHTSFDQSGALAAKGTIDEVLLRHCMQIPYISKKPPKSTGHELFGKEFTIRLIQAYDHLSKYDLLATLTAFTAHSIVENYRLFLFSTHNYDEVIVSGGGSFNQTLLRMMEQLLHPYGIRTITLEEIGHVSAAKEAIAFAILAYETLQHKPSNIPSATGAKESVMLGNITFPNKSAMANIT
ncbi:anhydro-N-acetylmuramic acid kinase AnmK [Seinonella peptonophila]|uniref:anhydro-N-acetylmuramic acid kinase AnmK n=1 Tax=Seinonella peptonophila TaxID=112248 RepID=UPI0015876502|nr:anhydro-N-acetylmuramic acid kinase AnmK [Seinonella peptonophila]